MAAMGKTRSNMRQGLGAEPKLVTHGKFPRGDYSGMTDKDLEEFNRLRWENVEKQLAKIREKWDGTEPMWGIVTVETGIRDFKKIGLEMRAEVLDGAHRSAFQSKWQEMRNLLKGKTERRAGDMDAIVEINGIEELTCEEIKEKALILQQQVHLAQVKIGEEIFAKGRGSRISDSSGGTGRGSHRPSDSSHRPSDSSPRRSSSPRPGTDPGRGKVQRELKTVFRKAKEAGMTLAEVEELLRTTWPTLPEPADSPDGPSRPRGPSLDIPSPGTPLPTPRDNEGLPAIVRFVMASNDLAYMCFNFDFAGADDSQLETIVSGQRLHEG